MKKYFIHICITLACGFFLTSCSDWLDVVPKGKKVPATLEDYRAFVEKELYSRSSSGHARQVVNEFYVSPNSVSTNIPREVNFLWLADGERIPHIQTDDGYNNNYQAIFYANLVINDVPTILTSTQAEADEAKEIVAQAKVLRALHYFYLVNTYAKAYDKATAAASKGVPYIATSDDFETPVPQKTVQEIYDYMLDDLNSALPHLPETSRSFYQPSKAAGYAILARVHLFMKNFDKAFECADESIKRNSFIFDMVAYHKTHIDPDGIGRDIQGNSAAFSGLPKITFFEGREENLLMMYGNYTDNMQGLSSIAMLPLADSAENVNCTRGPERFEDGDTRFLCNFYRNTSSKYYSYSRSDKFNGGGIRTPEVYLMRAECYARQGNLQKAMDDLNTVRKKRIIAGKYQDLTASTVAEAMDYIRRERDNELIGTDMMFFDMRRFNTEAEYKRTMKKKDHKGIIRTLEPDSELWVMPFPASVTLYNSNIEQNTAI